jgi:hypothetical protein
MEHEQVEKMFSSDGPGSVLAGFGMEIPEGDHAVFALEDILFPDDAPVQVSAKINDCLVAVAGVFAVNNPLFRTIFGYSQAIVNNGLQELCPEELKRYLGDFTRHSPVFVSMLAPGMTT